MGLHAWLETLRGGTFLKRQPIQDEALRGGKLPLKLIEASYGCVIFLLPIFKRNNSTPFSLASDFSLWFVLGSV